MSDRDNFRTPEAWLQHLHDAGHWDRLIDMASRSLSDDPNDANAHRHIAWAYVKKDRLTEMWPHVSHLLNSDPDDVRHHHLAAVYYLESRRHKQAKPHIDLLLQREPREATYHYLACIHALRANQLDAARFHIMQARSIAPNWAPAAHLEIRMDGIRQRKASDAWNRIRRLEQTLGLDPQNASVMSSIGEIYLQELERPRDAERFFRQALFIEPGEKVRQGKLLDAIRARSLLYRTLSLPTTSVRNFRRALAEQRIRWFLPILAFKIMAIYLVWLIVVGCFFAPAAMIYEWFVLLDVARSRPSPRLLRPLNRILAWPFFVRISLSLGLIASLWFFILWQGFKTTQWMALEIIGWTFGGHLALVLLFVGIRRLRSGFGQWQDRGARRRQESLAAASGIAPT